MEGSSLIVNLIKDFPLFENIDAIYLFGSRATGRASVESDYDLAFLFSPVHIPTVEQQFALKSRLEEGLSADVDLIILNLSNPIINIQAISKGILLWEKNRFRRALFTATLYSQYAELKEMRAPMEKNILRRKYYGG